MGSLPNLRDLERDEERLNIPRPAVKYVPRRECESVTRCDGLRWDCPALAVHSRTMRQTRSMGSYTSSLLNQHDKIHFYHSPEDGGRGGRSPNSPRSTRSSCTLHHHINNSIVLRRHSRQRDSMSSSGGASSVRRLIAVVRSTPSKSGPVYSRRLLLRNFAALCLGHAMVTAAFVPLFTLQGSISVWWWQSEFSFLPHFFNPIYDIGSILLASLFAVGSMSTFMTVFLVNKLGSNWTLILSYSGTCIFLGFHLYPNVFTLVPAYIFMGIWLGPLVGARLSCVMTLANKLTYVMTEQEEDEVECSQGLRRTEIVVYKLSRGLQIAQDFGLIIGNVVTSFLIWYTSNTLQQMNDTNTVLDSMFSLENNGERICGSNACPMFMNNEAIQSIKHTNVSSHQLLAISCKTSTMLVSVFLGFCVMGVAVTAAFMDHIRVLITKEKSYKTACCTSFRKMQDAFRDSRLQLAAPLSIFIGLEQGFMYSDFTKSYVACALGITDISLVFLTLGLLETVAACTLSLLLQQIRRHIVIAVGFIFQSCLLLVLLVWTPSKEDPALFFVVPAAWGVCNAIWDTLSFSLMVSIFPDTWQAPFAHCYFFRYLGLAVAFGTHGLLCNWIKLYGLAAAMIIAITPYTWLEIKHESRKKFKCQLSSL